MNSVALPIPASERAFWDQVVDRWVSAPGLLVVVVPEDLNKFETGRSLRDQACRLRYTDHESHPSAPDPQETYCHDSAEAGRLGDFPGPKVLPFVLAAADRLALARRAAQGESALFLMVTGLQVTKALSVDDWIRSVIEGWPGVKLAAKGSRFHCCCLVTASLPQRQPLLPEGCDRLVVPDAEDHEISVICSETVHDYWRTDGQHTCRYMRSCVVDMASGRRIHAELALVEMITDWERRSTRDIDWTPRWSPESETIRWARAVLREEGVDSLWLGISGGGLGVSASAAIGHLWARGLWRKSSGLDESAYGLTALARAALMPPDYPGPGMPPVPVPTSDAAIYVFRQSLHVEQMLKSWLRQALLSSASRDRIRAILDAGSEMSPEQTLRDCIAAQVSEWQTKIPADQTRLDHVAISICSFGVLRGVVLDLLPPKQRDRIRTSLNALVAARNLAAHGGWFTLREYQLVCEHVSRIVSALPSLRI